MPPNKRPRPSGNAGASGSGRTKRAKKVEEPTPASDDEVDSQKKGKEGEEGELHTKIDFRDLPDDTLYKYLEMHSLLPVWFRRPWDEAPMQRPRDLYHTAFYRAPSPSRPTVPASTRNSDAAVAYLDASERREADERRGGPTEPSKPEEAEDDEDVDMDGPSTRSKTAPQRKDGDPAIKLSSEVFTLSDVQTARDILAERANQHWVKGLGGGQNKESETIVNFLYKLKVGPGRLLKVYNPSPSHFPSRV